MPIDKIADKEDVVDTHSGILLFLVVLYSVTKKNEVLPFIEHRWT